jgi:hypothetical protein
MGSLNNNDETDLMGFPKRKFGDRIIINVKKAIVIENMGLTVLCPCTDSLRIAFEGGRESVIDNASFETW